MTTQEENNLMLDIINRLENEYVSSLRVPDIIYVLTHSYYNPIAYRVTDVNYNGNLFENPTTILLELLRGKRKMEPAYVYLSCIRLNETPESMNFAPDTIIYSELGVTAFDSLEAAEMNQQRYFYQQRGFNPKS